MKVAVIYNLKNGVHDDSMREAINQGDYGWIWELLEDGQAEMESIHEMVE